MLLSSVLLILGFGLLIKGADWMVNGSSSLAKKFKVPDLLIGLTIVAFGTSAPELVVNIFASIDKRHDIIFGNVIGSNNFNLYIILGIVGLITPIAVKSSTVNKEIPISLLALLLLFFLCNGFLLQGDYLLSRFDGLILFSCFFLFLFYIYRQLITGEETQDISPLVYSNLKIWILIIGGLAGLIVGGKMVVDAAIDIATSIGISQQIIGLTIVAAGTSLPELTTSVIAALKKNSDIAIGNVIGSNIFNILLILSISTFVNPITYNPKFNVDMYLLAFGTTLLFLAMFTGKKKILDRWESLFLLLIYIGYTIYLLT
ncbi:MAG TPA: calcium/sodium antiporter [Anditalea sp.]|nr:calcium/sodium antiporter [Anditalea sp.]